MKLGFCITKMKHRSHVSFPFLLFPLKSQLHAIFLTISHQISIYKSCDQILESSTASKRVHVE
ncbi:hypothetical protein T05_9949 [Trichinella murrelli]|uniref:Uncharacterized protein n=1 Tax=Trichinella murrelli TaxID=144512 RepID=A0A0V0TDZ4_9BILA|nr:hypothetical protein T05_9949 [Trichinella murrelli]